MSGRWLVSSGAGVSAGAGPGGASASKFLIQPPSGPALTAWFAGFGLSVGGPASATYSTDETPGTSGELVWAAGVPCMAELLRTPPNGFILGVGSAPGELFKRFGLPVGLVPEKWRNLSGLSLNVVGFGLTMPSSAAPGVPDIAAVSSVLMDIRAGGRGLLLTGVRAYAQVVSAQMGVDVGGVGLAAGQWFFV
jgi:hypothetical protein